MRGSGDRRKRNKACRKAAKYYRIHFGFREPYKVLLDGNFLHAMTQLKFKEDNLEEQFSHLLGGKVRLFVPSCALRELQQLAKDDKMYKAAAALARKFVRHKDACPPEMPNSDCLLKQLEDDNAQHWWLATQDGVIIQAVRRGLYPAVPIVTATAQGVRLLAPPDATKATVDRQTHDQLHLADHEVPPPVRPARVSNAVPASASDQAGATSAEDAVKVKPHKKRHKAAAPNPLAVQKPKKGAVQLAPAGPGTSKKVRRKRSKAAMVAGSEG